MKRLSVLILSLFIVFATQAQRSCRFHTLLQEELSINKSLLQQKNNFEKEIPLFLKNVSAQNITLPDTIFIPLVFHVLWHTPTENIIDSQITSQVRILNEDFRSLNSDTINTPPFFKSLRGKTRFWFVLAKQDPYGMPTNGINRVYTFRKDGFALDGRVNITKLGGQDAWDPRFYVNIWVCNMESASGTIGATYFPGGSLKRDGIMIDYRYLGSGGITLPPYNLGRTMTHEMGHYFNLDHTWGPTDISFLPFCGDDDHVEDTPPQSNANYYCPIFPRPSCGNTSDMYMSYMDYVDDPCMNMFSKGQVERMLAAWYIMTPYLRQSRALETPFPSKAADAGITAILYPVDYSFTCNTSDKIIAVLRNFGTDTLHAVNIIVGINGDTSSSKIYRLANLSIPPQMNDTINLEGKFTYPYSGSLSLFVSTQQPNKSPDGNPSNNRSSITINVQDDKGIRLPYVQYFNEIPFPPKGIGLENPDKLFTWTATNGSQLSGLAPSIMMDNIEYPFPGRKDYLMLPPVDLSGTDEPALLFLHAYQLYVGGQKEFSDTLTVEVSINCGKDWQRIFYKGGLELASVKRAERGYFSPDKPDQWASSVLSLGAWRGNENVWIRFVNICGSENLLYLDNIIVKDVVNKIRAISAGIAFE